MRLVIKSFNIQVISLFVEKKIIPLTKILNMGKEMGYRKAWLGVWENNFRAIKFYRKYGFKKFGQHSFLLGKDLQTDYLLVMNV